MTLSEADVSVFDGDLGFLKADLQRARRADLAIDTQHKRIGSGPLCLSEFRAGVVRQEAKGNFSRSNDLALVKQLVGSIEQARDIFKGSALSDAGGLTCVLGERGRRKGKYREADGCACNAPKRRGIVVKHADLQNSAHADEGPS